MSAGVPLLLILLAAACSATLPGPSHRARPTRDSGPTGVLEGEAHSQRRDDGMGGRSTSARIAWRRSIGPSLLGPLEVSGGSLFAATGNGTVVAFSAGDGERYWRRRLGGVLPALAVHEALWVFTAGADAEGLLHGHTLRDGRQRWRRAMGPSRYPPAPTDSAIYGVTDNGGAYALDALDGGDLWHTRLSGRALAAPLIYGAQVFVATSADTVYRLDRRTGATTAAIPLAAAVSGPLVAAGETLLVPLHSGHLATLDPMMARVRAMADLGAPIVAAPVLTDDGMAYVLTRDAVLWRVDPRSARAEQVTEFDGAARASLAQADGQLYVGLLDGTLIAMSTDGSEHWRIRLGDSIVAPVTVRGRSVFVPLLRGEVVKLEVGR